MQPAESQWHRLSPDELLQHHQFAREHDLIVCSDEIHCELLLEPGVRHAPFATLNDDAAQRSVTLIAVKNV